MKKILFLILIFAMITSSLYAMEQSENEDELLHKKEDIAWILEQEADMTSITHCAWGITMGIASTAGVTASLYGVNDIGIAASALLGVVAFLMCGNAYYDKKLPHRCRKVLDAWKQARVQRFVDHAIDEDERELEADKMAV